MANLTSVGISSGVPNSGSGTVSTLDNLIGVAGTPSANVQSVQGVSGGTAVPVSAAALPLPALAATSTKQSDGSQKTQVVDGSGNVQPSGDTAARALFEKLTDGTSTVAVKAASTAPTATDPALVVAISPNSVNANSQQTMANSAPVVIASDQSALTMQLASAANLVSGAITTAMTGTTTTSLLAAPGSSLHNMITQVTVSNAHATVGTDIILQDGSGGTTLYTIPAAANYGGATITFNPPLRQPTANTALFVANVTTGASTKASASGFKAA